MKERTASFLSDLRRARSPEEVWTGLAAFAAAFGMQKGILGMLRLDPARAAMVAEDYRTNLPADPVREYVDSELYRSDPVYDAHLRLDRPSMCHTAWYRRAALAPDQRRVFETAFLAEAPFRLVMPAVFVGSGRSLGVLLGGDVPARDVRALFREAVPVLWLASAAAMWRLADRLASPEPTDSPLTARERECLTHLAAGERVDRIADRLGLSNATVDLHLARARAHLGARTSPEAVAKAILRGWIRP